MNNKLVAAMRILGITESKLAESVNVDRSLINKWKSGSRAMSGESLSAVIAAIEEIYDSSEEAVKKRFLSLLPAGTAETDGAAVSKYFFDDTLPAVSLPETGNRYFSYVYSEKPADGIAMFFKSIADRKGGALKIYLETLEDANAPLAYNIGEALLRGIHTDIIITAAGDASGLLGLIAHAFDKNVNIFIRNSGRGERSFFVYGKDAGLILNKTAQGIIDYSEYFADVIRSGYLYDIFSDKLRTAIPLFGEGAGGLKEAAALAGRDASSSPAYIFSAIPLFFTLSQGTASEILLQNGITGAAKEKALADYAYVKNIYINLLKSGRVAEAYLPEELEKAVKMRSLKLILLSEIVKKPVFAGGELADKARDERLSLISAFDNYETGHIMKKYSSLPAETGCFVKQYGFAGLWKSGQDKILLTGEPLCSGTVFLAAEALWKSSPDFSKDKKGAAGLAGLTVANENDRVKTSYTNRAP